MTNETVEKLGAALLQDIEPGQQSGIVTPGRSHRPPKQEPAAPAQKRGRPKKAPLSQTTIFDIYIEDGEIEAALEVCFENEEAVKATRAAKKLIKERLQLHHQRAVVGLLDEPEEIDPADVQKGPYGVVGNYRFLAMAPRIPAKAVPAKVTKFRHGWRFEAAAIVGEE